MPQFPDIAECAVVEFADKGKIQLGFVVSVDPKTSKVKLVNQLKREVVLPPKQVLHVLTRFSGISPHYPVSQISEAVTAIELKATDLMKSIDVEELWELNSGESDEVSLELLLGLLYTEPGAVERLAMIRALRADRVYFKETTFETYQLRSASNVSDIKQQLAARAEKDRFRRRFVEEACAMLAIKNVDEREEACENRDPALDSAWKAVESYALFGAEAQEHVEADQLLALLQKELGRGFAGTAHQRARAFLRESGYWTREANVALLRHDIPQAFESNVELAAFALYKTQPGLEGRTDLTGLALFSIDDAETLDIDDALSVEHLVDGNIRLGIHIASPASAFAYDSLIEREARTRATSIYLPDSRIPMLPAILSENALSLMEGQKRAAMSFFVTYDARYNVVARDIVRSVVVSKHRLTYDAAERMIEFGNDALSDMLRTILEITETSALSRRAAGAIDVNLPENKVVLDRETGRYSLHSIDNGMMSRGLVAECMIIANAFVADFCAEHEIPALYRLQASPTGMPTAEELDAMPNDYIRAISQRRCMQPAGSSMTPGRHAGLGLERYLQATSPLRRYIDLMIHYQLEAFLATGAPRFDSDGFSRAMTAIDGPLSAARAASNEANQFAVLSYFAQEREQTFEAIIVQYNPDRPDHPQVMLLLTQTRATISLRKRFVPGTIINVRVDHVDPEDGTLILQFVGEVV